MPAVPEFGPRVFGVGAVDPETAAFNARLEAQGAAAAAAAPSSGSPTDLAAARRGVSRARALELSPLSPNATTRSVPGPAGNIPVRVFLPDVVRGIYLHMHGGAWVLGSADQQDRTLEAIAQRCRLAVLSVDYRLAPEHPYPAAPDDCETVALWLAEHALAEFGADRLLIGGSSSGANLAVVTLLRLRERHGFTSFAAANLQFGMYDLSLTPSMRAWGTRTLFLTLPAVRWALDQYVPPHLRQHPDVSPLYADLSSLPPALFTIGTQDPTMDDSLFMSSRWIAAGNRAELSIYPGGCHEFTGFPLKIAAQANARIQAFLTRAVEASAAPGGEEGAGLSRTRRGGPEARIPQG